MRRFVSLSIFALILSASAPDRVLAGNLLAVDPLTRGTVVEAGSDILPVWLTLGIRKATLLNVSSEDGLGPLDAQNIARIKKAAAEGVLTVREGASRLSRLGLYGEEDYLRAAYELGVISEIYWIAPFAALKGPGGGAALADHFRARGLPEESATSFKPVEGCWKGDAAGIPLTVCPREELPSLTGPVLVNFESSYFPFAASERKTRFVAEVKNFFTEAASRGYEVAHASLTPSTYSGKLGLNLRWIPETALEILRHPAELSNPQTPARWTTLENGYALVMDGKGREAEEKMIAYLSMVDKTDQGARVLLAQALLLQNRFNDAYKLFIETCEADKGYCYGLVDTGLGMVAGGAIDLGLVFFERADALAPELIYMEDARGSALLAVERWAEASKFYGRLAERDGQWPHGLLLGLARLGLGEKNAALESFAKAADALDPGTRYTANPADLSRAVKEGAALLREAGMGDKAARLEGDARLSRYSGR